MRLGGQRHAPAASPPGKTRYPLYTRLGGPHGRSGRVRKISTPPGFDPRTVHRVATQNYFIVFQYFAYLYSVYIFTNNTSTNKCT
jgi:hypothetical protein